ncbi:hypothetical protein EMM73_14660 [Rheinheimera sediminis]|uniref:hypothetical protein n=1 Tax=Rheinheimera sp. YQF-1 TaxID=2499626 RepID=UPI000FD794CF|nr:hypothetical protein [Rheinheimera sp. YQF-1]RVT45290.1 hypothetical protein EMM73_14660 [Rheinheimera sp. YQF-1]
MLHQGEFEEFADRFGYAVALGRNLVVAISADFNAALETVEASRLNPRNIGNFKIRLMDPTNIGINGIVEHIVKADNGRELLIEYVLSDSDGINHITCEQIGVLS